MYRIQRIGAQVAPQTVASPLLLPALPAVETFQSITYTVDDATHVAIVTLNRPASGNAIDTRLFLEIMSALAHAARDDNVWSLIWTGAGKVFCAGADFSGNDPDAYTAKDPRSNWTGMYRGGVEATLSDSSWVAALGEAFYGMEKPQICALNGAAAGAGFAIALCCDIRVACDDAKFVPAFTAAQLPPEAGLSYLLSRVVGLGHAMDVLLTGRTVTSEEALRIGLITRKVGTREVLLQCAKEYAVGIAKFPQPAVRMTKAAVQRGLEATFQECLRNEVSLARRSVSNPFSAKMSLESDSKLARIRKGREAPKREM